MKSKSYKISDCCNCECDYRNENPESPCWGDVEVVDEIVCEDDYYWVHACEGHREISCGGQYFKENENQTIN